MEVETLDVDEENVGVQKPRLQYILDDTQMASIDEELPSSAKLLPEPRDIYESDDE